MDADWGAVCVCGETVYLCGCTRASVSVWVGGGTPVFVFCVCVGTMTWYGSPGLCFMPLSVVKDEPLQKASTLRSISGCLAFLMCTWLGTLRPAPCDTAVAHLAGLDQVVGGVASVSSFAEDSAVGHLGRDTAHMLVRARHRGGDGTSHCSSDL